MNRNEAIRRIKSWNLDRDDMEVLAEVIPELKESESENEGEKIRKSLISILKSDFEKDTTIYDISVGDMIVWLEKQGEQTPVPFKAEHGKYYYCIKDYFSDGKKQASKGDVVQALRGLPIMGLDDASEFFLPVNDIQLNKGTNHNNSPKFKVGDTICPKGSMAEFTIESIDAENYYGKGWRLSISAEDDYELVEAKTCKVEPKFKVGDWVVTTDGKVNQVKAVSDDGEAYTLDDETYFSGSWKDMYHLWTIEDAKDGDVLAEHETIVLFKQIEGLNIRSHFTYKYLNNSWVCKNDLHNKRAYSPATKEQRDKLFTKMSEEGYEWDAEKKELKKIEQNPAGKFEPKFREGDSIQFKGFGHNRYTIKEVCGLTHYINTMGNRMDMSYTDANFEVIKDSDKVEPKFKVGDWIVYDKYGTKDIDRIVKFDNGIVRFESSTWLFVYQLNKDCKLWTIEDAEGGDVLSCENGWTCIFKALDNHTNTFSSYCFMDKKGWFCEYGGQGHTLDNRICGEIHPATKEQRDLLFQKIKEAGYEWDAEKMELKKIEEKPDDKVKPKFKVGDWVVTKDGKVNQVKKVNDDDDAYTLDDKTYFSGSWKDMYHLWTIQDAKDGDVLYNYKDNTGVEAIHLVKGWEDVEGIGRTLCSIATYRVLDDEVIKGGLGAIWWEGNRLEFRPATEEEKKKFLEKMEIFEKKQKTWKPTREQLRQLDAVVDAYAVGSKTHTELRSLSEDLKKLK